MIKIYSLTFLLIACFTFRASAQETILTEINLQLLEKYIQLAKESYPKRKAAIANVESARNSLSMAKVSYLDVFNASYFYRPGDENVVNIQNPYSVNGWQLGFNVSLGQLLAKPSLIKRAKAEHSVAQFAAQDFDNGLVTEVKKRYYAVVQAAAQVQIASRAFQDNKNISETSQSRFERGEVSLELFSNTRQITSASSSAKIQAEVAYLLAKDSLEEIIGKKLSEVQ